MPSYCTLAIANLLIVALLIIIIYSRNLCSEQTYKQVESIAGN